MYLLTSKPRAWGGAMHFEYRCIDCKSRMEFDSSARIGDTLRLEVPTLVLLGSLLGGFHFAGYERQMSMIIGDNTASPRTWQTFLHWIQPKIKQLLDTQATAAHDDMKKIDPGTLGSFQRAVTTSDGAWHHRGFHSGNASYVVINYFNKALLQYGHVSMRARNKDESWPGTAKAAEGHLATVCFAEMKKLGMKMEVNFQDGDSSSEQAVEGGGARHHLWVQKSLCASPRTRAGDSEGQEDIGRELGEVRLLQQEPQTKLWVHHR